MSSTHPIHFAARRCTASLFLAIAALVVALGCGSSDGGDPGAASGAGTGVGGAGNVDGGAADGSPAVAASRPAAQREAPSEAEEAPVRRARRRRAPRPGLRADRKSVV